MEKRPKQLANKKRVAQILKYIEDKDTFILELISAVNKATSDNDPRTVEKCLDEWEASAELNSIPGFSKKVWSSFNSLVKAGLIPK
jgi:hypothetical protein